VFKGLRPSCNYFLKPRGLSANCPDSQGPLVNLQQAHGILCKIARIYQILELFLTEKPMDRVHGRCEQVVQSGP
jgi:hypothetical protein